ALVVVDDLAARLVPDLDPHGVAPTPARQLAVNRGQQEAITAAAVERAYALVLGLRARHHQPLIAGALEIHTRCVEGELGLAAGGAGAFGVSGSEPKAGLAHQ